MTMAPELAARSSALWTELSEHLGAIGRGDGGEVWQKSRDALGAIRDIEEQLFTSLSKPG